MTMASPSGHTSWSELRHDRSDQPTESAATQFDVDLGQLIYDLRTEAGLSQRELAERMGTTQSVISRLEEGGGAKNQIDTLARVRRRSIGISCCRSLPRSPTSSPTLFRWREKSSQKTHGTDVNSRERRGATGNTSAARNSR